VTRSRFLWVGLVLLAFLFQQQVYAGGNDEKLISKEIAHLLEKIRYHKVDDTTDGQYDSLEIANKRLADFIINTGQKADMISMPFRELDSSSINILTSDDKNFRIYCWNTETGGTMRFFNALAQYRSVNGIKTAVLNRIDAAESAEDFDPGYWYHQLYTVKDKNGKAYYLPLYVGIYSGRDRMDGIKAYTIDNDQLNDSVQLFKTTKASINAIDYAYDAFNSYEDKDDRERPTIHLNEEKTKVYIPIISEEKFTGRWLIYVFNGEQFVYDKNATY
jgi:hypothetical protein